jgi:hypothetical protein
MTSGSRRGFLSGTTALLLGMLGLRAHGENESGADPWGLTRLMREFAVVRSARARFTETKYLKMLDRPIKSSGTLAYEAPARLEKLTLLPKRERMLVERDKVTLETGAQPKRRVLSITDNPLLRAFIESIRATLAGDLATLERFYRVELDGAADHWQLRLEPADAKTKSAVRVIRITGSGGEIGSVEVEQSDGDRSVMTMVRDDS